MTSPTCRNVGAQPFLRPCSLSGLAKLQLLLLIVGAVVVVLAGARLWKTVGGSSVDYPYWCKDCQAVFDRSELGNAPEKWKVPPGARSDSVVFCLRCKEGSAYPAARCLDCGTVHVFHLWRDNNCPKCHPEIAQAAAAKGIDLMPKKLN